MKFAYVDSSCLVAIAFGEPGYEEVVDRLNLCERLFSSNLAAGTLKGADLWHVACALFLSPEPKDLAFLTLDRPQKAVVRALGFPSLE